MDVNECTDDFEFEDDGSVAKRIPADDDSPKGFSLVSEY